MRILTIAIACGVLAACGGDDDGSGVDGDKPFSEATVEDAMAFCEYVEALIDREADHKIECYIDGIIGDGDEGRGCQEIADECLAEPIEEEPSECSEIDESDLDEIPACASEVTFGEYEACFEAFLSRNAEIAAEISCETDLQALFEQYEDVPEPCQHVREECPELFGDDAG